MRAVLLVLLVSALAAAPAAAAPEAHHCGNVDRTNRFGQPSPRGAFGIFGVTAQGVGCRPARRVAHLWLRWAEHAANPTVAHVIGAYLCRGHLPRAQELAVRCSTKTALIRFTWRIANG